MKIAFVEEGVKEKERKRKLNDIDFPYEFESRLWVGLVNMFVLMCFDE